MRKENKFYTHYEIKDRSGKDYLCPAAVKRNGKTDRIDQNVCFEKDIPGRYAARITIRES